MRMLIGMRLMCSSCGQLKKPDDFSPEPRNVLRSQRRSNCKTCCCEAAQERWRRDVDTSRRQRRANYAASVERCNASTNRTNRITQWPNALVVSARASSKAKQVPFDLDSEHILQLFQKQGRRCYWLGIPLVPSIRARDPQRPSLDRLKLERGYVRGNIVIASAFANLGRSVTDVKRFAEFVSVLREELRGVK
jgi:hypothetical protein